MVTESSFREFSTSGRSCTSEACWSSQELAVLDRSSGLLELTVLSYDSSSGCMIREKTQYFQFCMVHAALCLSKSSCSLLGLGPTVPLAEPAVGSWAWKLLISWLSCSTEARRATTSLVKELQLDQDQEVTCSTQPFHL